jgi:predicted metal-binding membrane protein
MWVVMMVAMMLPSLVPMLWRYRQAVARAGETRLGRLTALVGVGYFFVWTVFGMAAFPLGVALAVIEMHQPALTRAVPIAVGVVVLIAGAFQFTALKVRHLAYCREAPGRGRTLPGNAGAAWRHGLRLGLNCGHCCASRLGREHVILEEKWPGHRWRTERWDAFAYLLPNWTLQLPDYVYLWHQPSLAPR